MHIMRRHAVRAVVVLLLLAAGAVGVGLWWVRGELRASLALLDGRASLPGLHGAVTVTRDALGIPTIQATSREDVARATGFLHAQDRFFQMDLARRRAAGELAALVGARALPVDRQTRIHRFRAEARQAVTLLRDRERRILRAYVDGVNTGLSRLGAPPFEYLLLRQKPVAWREEDTLLVVLSMFLTLQDSDGLYDSTIATMQDLLPQEMVEFLVPPGTEWDSPVEGGALGVPPIPGPQVFNLRARRTGTTTRALPPPRVLNIDATAGSNSFAVAGPLTDSGAPLLANDMHLPVRVPNTWYRAVYAWSDPDRHQLVGATLPGHPAMVIGSNTNVAWGFTNTWGDFTDIVLLDTDPQNPERYRTPDGWHTFDRHDEVITVAGAADEHLTVDWTMWGPVIQPDHTGRARALRWVAHSPDMLASTMTPFEDAGTIDQLFDEANGAGAPGQNILAVDRSGRIGWSIFGTLPQRVGTDGIRPASWADGAVGWRGFLQRGAYPRIFDPPGGRLWTANARVAGEASRPLGQGNYDIGARARIIRDRLLGRDRFRPRDLLDVQLDTNATFLARWRDLILHTLTPAAIEGHPDRIEFRDVVEQRWTGQVTADSAAYALTREFRDRVSERVIAFILADCYDADPTFEYRIVRRREGPIWKLVTEQPAHLLDPAFGSWADLLLASADEAIGRIRRDHPGPLADRSWGEFNQTVYRHPLSGALPFLPRWLDMPRQPLPGDLFTPNMHWGANAPSERMIVSPGREEEGIMEMPTGQSGHPLSPYYANSHPAWVEGELTPLMPGKPQHSLLLEPDLESSKLEVRSSK